MCCAVAVWRGVCVNVWTVGGGYVGVCVVVVGGVPRHKFVSYFCPFRLSDFSNA